MTTEPIDPNRQKTGETEPVEDEGSPQEESVNPAEEAAKKAAQEGAAAAEAGKPSGEAGDPDSLTAEQIDELKTQAAKANEYWDQLLRQRAEYENLKKRTAREREEAIRYANEDLIEKLLPIVDNFEMALKAAENQETASVENLRTGIEMVYNQLLNLLKENGIEPVDAAGQPFDPQLHDALSQEESREVPEGQVLYQTRKGYKLRDRLIRPASVVVAKSPDSTEAEKGSSSTPHGPQDSDTPTSGRSSEGDSTSQ